jgi:hypothetical protein
MADSINLFSSICGIVGLGFGVWKYWRERQIRALLAEKIAELDRARSRLKTLEAYADGLARFQPRT